MKICYKCKVPKEETEFNRSNTVKAGLQHPCRECSKKRDRERDPIKAAARERKCYETDSNYPLKKRAKWLKAMYGLSLERFDEMLVKQAGKCEICGEVMLRPFVDHCHKTNKNRGLLCRGCNLAIGFLKDSSKNCVSAARYLKMARYLK